MKSFRLPRFLRTLGLPAVTLLAPLSVWADTTISSDFTQNGGTFTVSPPTLLVTHGSNDPTLTLTNGANASWEGATIIGNLAGESGNLEILGGSMLANSGSGFIEGAYGSFHALRGWGYLGFNAGSTGKALVSGEGSQWNSPALAVGRTGNGELIVELGASILTQEGHIGWAGGYGSAKVTGTGSQWNSNIFFVGSYGSGEVIVEAGASVSNTSTGRIGSYDGSQGAVTITGAGSQWMNASDLHVGYDGTGTLTVVDGGQVTAQTIHASLNNLHGDGVIAAKGVVLDGVGIVFDNENGSQQTFEFGAGGQLQLDLDGTGGLGVGHKGAGSLTISDGAVVSSSYGVLGSRSNSQGSATVSGTGSQWVSSGNFYVGQSGTGELLVEAGGSVLLTGSGSYILGSGGGEGSVAVIGAGSQLIANGRQLRFGQNGGTGSLLVEEGASVSNWWGIIGGDSSSNGTVLVKGAGSQWTNSGQLTVGSQGTGEMTIADGGSVSNTIGHIGNSNGSSGEVTVTGEGSLWTNTGNLILGGTTLTDQTTATGELTIADGGTVTVGGTTRVHGGGIILIGEDGALETDILLSNGEVIVSGSLSAENGVSVEFGGILGGGGEINGDLSLTAGAKFQFDLNSTLTVTGSVTLDSTFGIADLLGLDNTIALGTYILIDGTATDFSTLGLQNWGEENAYDLGNGKSAYFSQGSLQVTVVPEPGTCVLTGLGLAAILLRRGRRNARSVSGTIIP